MTSNIVQSAVGYFPNSGTGPFTASATLSGVTAGNSIVVATVLRVGVTSVPAITVSDGQGTYTDLETATYNYTSNLYLIADLQILSNANAGSHTITSLSGTGTGQAYGFIVAMEVSGLGPVDVKTSFSATGNCVSGSTASVAGTNELVISAVAIQSTTNTTIESSAGYTAVHIEGDGTANGGWQVKGEVDYLPPLLASGAQEDTWNHPGPSTITNPSAAVIVVFTAATPQPDQFVARSFSEDPTSYADNRIDHAARMFMLRRPSGASVKAMPLAMMQLARPPQTFFESPFVGVISSQEFGSYEAAPQAVAAQTRPLAYMVLAPNRVEDDKGDLPQARTHHATNYFVQPTTSGIAIQVYAQEFPDLCDTEWQEPWIERFDHDRSMFLLRQYGPYIQPPPLPLGILVPPPPSIFLMDPAPDVQRTFDHAGALFMFRQFGVAAPPPVIMPSTLRVKALSVGFYNGQTRNIGDVFDIPSADLALEATNFLVNIEGTPFFGWMVVVAATTPLQTNAPTPPSSTNIPRTVY